MQHILPYVKDNKKLAWEIARIAIRALYFEVKSYPKPGLVSFVDSGAHKDMNGETFYRSLFALRHYFYHLVVKSLSGASFDELKCLALCAEEKMLRATHGINTHRGALFALGILSVSTGRLLKKESCFSAADLQKKFIEDWQIILQNHQTNEKSHGNQVVKQFSDKKITTAKDMAIQGYPIVFKMLPKFIDYFEHYVCMNVSCLFIYLHLILQVDDTNILYRKGWEVLEQSRKKAHEVLVVSCMKERSQKALQLHQDFSIQGISPGGVGDLIGVFIFLGQLFSEKMRWHY